MNNKSTPTITYMMIDTTNKSTDDMLKEMKHNVEKLVIEQLNEYRAKLSDSDYATVMKSIETEKERIIKQFSYQIVHMGDIKRSRQLLEA